MLEKGLGVGAAEKQRPSLCHPPISCYVPYLSSYSMECSTVGVRQLDDLLDTMHERCQAVVDANGMHTKS